MVAILLLCSLSYILFVDGYRLGNNMRVKTRTLFRGSLNDLEKVDKNIIIEVVTRRPTSSKDSTKITASNSLYKQIKEEKALRDKVIDSGFGKFIGMVLNPTTLLLGMYVATYGWSGVIWLQRFLKIFGMGTLAKNSKNKTVPVEDLPFQTYECEKCGMQMKPARGRATAIFGKERFRCSRCGAKAEAYFDIDDLNDPRAVERLERLEKEKREEEEGDDSDE